MLKVRYLVLQLLPLSHIPSDYKRTLVFPAESDVFDLTWKILNWFVLNGSSEATVLEFLLDMIKHSSSALCNHLMHYLQCKSDFTELVFSRYAGHYLLEDQCQTNSHSV